MIVYRLVISVDIDTENEAAATKTARAICKQLLQSGALHHIDSALYHTSKVALTRGGDRSAKNLLLPKLQGRLGEHYQNRKADLSEVVQVEATQSQDQ